MVSRLFGPKGALGVALLVAASTAVPQGGHSQTTKPIGRHAARGLEFESLRFDPPRVQERTLSSGVSVFLMEDHSLPLVTVYARFRGGYALLPRESYASAFALPALLRTGGTTHLPPDSVDFLLDFYALSTTFGGGGESTFSSVNTLAKHLEPAIGLWSEILKYPRFDADELEIWRARQLESIRRRGDAPGLLAVSEFNRIMFGDHPIGWQMEEADLTADRLSPEAVSRTYSSVVCPENLILGVVGDVRWDRIEPLLTDMLADWPPCSGSLLEPRIPELREGREVFLIPKDLSQSHIIVAGPGGVAQSPDPDYFASRIGNSILGAGGFSSRLLSRVRTEEGYAYSASSFWTTPARFEGIVGATTQTKSESTVEVTRLLLDTMEDLAAEAPEEDEVDRVISQIVNSFVFNFQDPSQIVSRQMYFLARELPEDWLERFVQGIQEVEPDDIQRVFRQYVEPENMTILIVGNPDEFDFPPGVLGKTRIWHVSGGEGPDGTGGSTESRRVGRRSPH
jgi:zinc protease